MHVDGKPWYSGSKKIAEINEARVKKIITQHEEKQERVDRAQCQTEELRQRRRSVRLFLLYLRWSQKMQVCSKIYLCKKFIEKFIVRNFEIDSKKPWRKFLNSFLNSRNNLTQFSVLSHSTFRLYVGNSWISVRKRNFDDIRLYRKAYNTGWKSTVNVSSTWTLWSECWR